MEKTNNGDKGAFASYALNNSKEIWQTGLTKREYASIMAMQGLLASVTSYTSQEWKKHIVEDSITMADELLKALEK